MQGALDPGSGRARCNNTASSPSSSSVSVLGLLQTICSNPNAVLSLVDNNSQSTQPYASPNVMDTVVKQLLQLAASAAAATGTSSAYHVTGAGSPLKNGVRACTCIVHLVLLQVWLEQSGWLCTKHKRVSGWTLSRVHRHNHIWYQTSVRTYCGWINVLAFNVCVLLFMCLLCRFIPSMFVCVYSSVHFQRFLTI
jgi:hypothetical protein